MTNRRGVVRRLVRLSLLVATLVLALTTLLPSVRTTSSTLRHINPILPTVALALEIASLFTYSLLTKSLLGSSQHRISKPRLFRIQLSTKALSSVVPGGGAAGPALAYRLFTSSGVAGADAGFAIATAAVGSAVTLNVIFWIALLISVPIRGVNAAYTTAAIVGIVVVGGVGAIAFGLLGREQQVDRLVRWVARRIRLDEGAAGAAAATLMARLGMLTRDRWALRPAMVWAAANWLLDAAALWLCIRAFGPSLQPDALLVSFGLVNVLAAIPITPAGIGVIDIALPAALVGFGMPSRTAVLAVATWRIVQWLIPTLVGGVVYATLRIGPYRIKRAEPLST